MERVFRRFPSKEDTHFAMLPPWKKMKICDIVKKCDQRYCYICSGEVAKGVIILKCKNQNWFTACYACKEKVAGCPHCRESDCNMEISEKRLDANEIQELFKEVDDIEKINKNLYIRFDDSFTEINVGCRAMKQEAFRGRGAAFGNEANADATLEGSEAQITLTCGSEEITHISFAAITPLTLCESLPMVYSFKDYSGKTIFQKTGMAIEWSEKILYDPNKYYPAIVVTVTCKKSGRSSQVYIAIACNEQLPGILMRSKVSAFGGVAIQAVDIPTNFKGFPFSHNNNVFLPEENKNFVNFSVFRVERLNHYTESYTKMEEMNLHWNAEKTCATICNCKVGCFYALYAKPYTTKTFRVGYYNCSEDGVIDFENVQDQGYHEIVGKEDFEYFLRLVCQLDEEDGANRDVWNLKKEDENFSVFFKFLKIQEPTFP